MELHSGLVHFPIALLVTAAVFEILGLLLKKESLRVSACHMVVASAIIGLMTAATGIAAAREVNNPDIAVTLSRHRLLGATVVGIAVILSVWKLFHRKAFTRTAAYIYVGLLLISALLAVGAGWLGGHVAHSHHSHSEHHQHLDDGAPAHDDDHHDEMGSHDH